MISIIVPVYNVEKYLPRCIDSILAQTYSNWELLLIDDGSLDSSGVLCDQYAIIDSRIRVFHKNNGGVSSARNMGLENAKGDWITFVDADDCISPETLFSCSYFFDSEDIIRFSMKFIYLEDDSQVMDYILPEMSQDEYISKVIARETILGVCGGIYRTELFRDNNIHFDDYLINGEDWAVLANLIFVANSVKLLSFPFYMYNKSNEQSCTFAQSFNKSYSALLAFENVVNLVNRFGLVGYTRSIAKAKCNLGYNFYVGIVKRRITLTTHEIDEYAKRIQLSIKDIVLGASSIKDKFFLLLIRTSLGQMLIKRIAN